MTLVRRVAMKVSGLVVRYASSGCKEWAEGLAREVEFIEDDWSALWWAAGSTRVLLDRREAPASSLSEAVAKARHSLESLRRPNFIYRFLFLQAVLRALRFFDASSRQQRAGCVLVVLAGTYMGIFDLLRTRMVQLPPNDEDAEAWAFYYRRELERRCGPGAFVGVVFSSAVYIVGVLLAERDGAGAHPILATSLGVILVCGALFFLWKRRQFQHQIEALDVILRETR
jgi:hypothetical protein